MRGRTEACRPKRISFLNLKKSKNRKYCFKGLFKTFFIVPED
jgi:hypothetical protein